MPEPKTIDNLGIDASIRWAQDQHLVDTSITQESRFVSKQATVDIASPFFVNEFDTLLQAHQGFITWASFSPPPGHPQQTHLFTHQAIPSLGSKELRMAQIQKIRDLMQNKQDSKEEKNETKESETLQALLQYIQNLDANVAQVEARRSQFSKG